MKTINELLDELKKADGAILYWQLPEPLVHLAVHEKVCRFDGDLLVHHQAVRNDDGSYSMKP